MSFIDIETFTRAQHGVLTTRQGVETFGANQFEYLVRSQRLLRVHRSVYRIAGAPLSRFGEIHAAVLAAPSRALASHLTALELHGLLPLRIGSPCHVSVRPTQNTDLASVEVHRSSSGHQHATLVAGIPVTDLARSVVDAGRFLQERYLGQLLDRAVVHHDLSAEAVDAALATAGKQRGAAKIRRVLDSRLELGDPTTIQSVLEARFARASKMLGLPPAIRQYPVGTYRLDVAWPDLMLNVELDGRKAHGRSRQQFEHDRQRGNFLTTERWTQYHFTYRDDERAMERALRPHFPGLR